LQARIRRLDDLVDQALDRWRGHPLPDRVFYAASALGDHSIIWVIIAALKGLRSDRDWKAALRVGAALAVESALVNLAVKSLFRRDRPVADAPRHLPLRIPRTTSFPSGHGTSAFTAAGLLSEGDRLWPLYYSLAVVIATSRAYVRIHHASDVVGGVLIGVVLARLARRLVPLQPS
jgi:undecaprenyl-diphosphatase